MSSTRREFLKNASAVAASVGLASSIDAQTLKRSGFVSPLTAGDYPYHPQDAGIRELCLLALDAAKSAGADYASVRFSRNRSQNILTRERRVQGLSDANTFGFGIRSLGKVVGMRTDVASQMRTPELWNATDMLGGNNSYWLLGAFGDGKGQPAQANSISHGCPPTRHKQINVISTGRKGAIVRGSPRSRFDGARYLSRGDCEALAKRIQSYSTADSMRIVMNSGNRGNTRFAVNQVSTAGDNDNASVSISTTFGKRTGTVNSNRLDEASLRESVRSAETLAKLSPEDPEAMPEPEPQQYADSLGWSEATVSLDPARRSGATREISEAARAAGLVATAHVETVAGATAIASSRGNFAYGRQTQLAFTTTVRTRDGSGSGWAGAAGHDWAQVDPKLLAERAIEKAKRSVNACGGRTGMLRRDPRAHRGQEPGAVAGVLDAGACGGRGTIILLDARRRNEDRNKGDARARDARGHLPRGEWRNFQGSEESSLQRVAGLHAEQR